MQKVSDEFIYPTIETGKRGRKSAASETEQDGEREKIYSLIETLVDRFKENLSRDAEEKGKGQRHEEFLTAVEAFWLCIEELLTDAC